MRKEKLIKNEHLSNSGNKKMQKKKLTCWYCKLNGRDIINEHGCCKRCGTNITKWKKMRDMLYPKELLDSKLLENNVLGDRAKFILPNDEGEY